MSQRVATRGTPEAAKREVRQPADRPSRTFRSIGVALGVLRVLNGLGSRPPVRPVNRDLALTVDSVRMVARDVMSLRLVRRHDDAPDRVPGGGSGGDAWLPAWRPGDHLDLVLPSGRVRQYSLCGDPADRAGYRIAVRRLAEGGGGSREVHELRPGTRLTARGPRAAFPLLRASRYLFMAGGIGITPILPMVRAVAASGADWRLVYAGRDRDLMPFLGELAELDTSGRVTTWSDAERGRPPTGAELLAEAPGPGSVGYLCGPPPMLAAVRSALDGDRYGGSALDGDRSGGSLEALHVERFAPPPVVGGRPFLVELARAGTRHTVPADRSVLSVLREHRPDLAYSCQQGFCGTCRTTVLAGEVDHRDHALTESERAGTMTVCVSRAKGDRLVLDL